MRLHHEQGPRVAVAAGTSDERLRRAEDAPTRLFAVSGCEREQGPLSLRPWLLFQFSCRTHVARDHEAAADVTPSGGMGTRARAGHFAASAF